MNYAVIGRILSWVLRTEGLLMLLPCLIALIYGEWQGLVYLALGVGAIAAGWLLSRKKIAAPPPGVVYWKRRGKNGKEQSTNEHS